MAVALFQHYRRLLFAFRLVFFAFCELLLTFALSVVAWCASLTGVLASSKTL